MNARYRKKRKTFEHDSDSDSDYSPVNDFYDKKEIKKSDKSTYGILSETKNEIIKTEPNIFRILKEPLLLNDRARLLQLFEIYKSNDPHTEQWLEMRDKVNNFFTLCKNRYYQYKQYTPNQHEKMEEQIKNLDNYNEQYTLRYKILSLNTNITNKQVIYSKYKELSFMDTKNEEYNKLLNWLNWVISLPYDKIKTFPDTHNFSKKLRHISQILDKELYGMKNVKEQVLLFVSSKINHPHSKKCSLGLIGPPGVGKTKLARLLANVLEFPFEQISFGGVSNPDFLKGHDYTYVGAQPGEIVKCLKRMKYKNGILFFDEFDKISNNHNICSALLHITDPSQNSDFRDNFLSQLTIDLSHIWFIYSMNKLPLDTAMKDRIFMIQVNGYDFNDKVCIIKNYILPASLKNINEKESSITLSDSVCKYIITKVSIPEEKGVRSIEKAINTIVLKLDFIYKNQYKSGGLRGFNVSFDIGKKLTYPLDLTKKIVDLLLL